MPQARSGDFAQAMMDLGRHDLPRPGRPGLRALSLDGGLCRAPGGLAGEFPRKAKKAPRQIRYGAAFRGPSRGDGAISCCARARRVDLLGGMAGRWRAGGLAARIYPLDQAILDAALLRPR